MLYTRYSMTEARMQKLKLSIATTDYDHFRDFRLGLVQAEGVEHTWLTLGHHEIFARFTFNREWDVSELSFAKFTAQVTRENSDIIGLPVVPKGVELTRVPDKSLSDLLAAGEIDCALIARPPTCFLQGHPDVVRLFPDYWEMEETYYKRTKVWPIMHIIAVQKHILEKAPWVARNLFNAFEESKRRSVERLLDPAVSRYPVAWLPTYMRKMRDLFDGDTFPYGIKENRPTIEQFLRYTYEQGIAHTHAKPEDLFPKGVMTLVRV